MKNQFKGLRSGPASNMSRKQKILRGFLILTGNCYKQQVKEAEFDFTS